MLIETYMTDWSSTMTNCAVASATSGHERFIGFLRRTDGLNRSVPRHHPAGMNNASPVGKCPRLLEVRQRPAVDEGDVRRHEIDRHAAPDLLVEPARLRRKRLRRRRRQQ